MTVPLTRLPRTTRPTPFTRSKSSSSAPPSVSPDWRQRCRLRSPCCTITSSCRCGASSNYCRRIRRRSSDWLTEGRSPKVRTPTHHLRPQEEVDLRCLAVVVEIQKYALRRLEFHRAGRANDCGRKRGSRRLRIHRRRQAQLRSRIPTAHGSALIPNVILKRRFPPTS